MYLIFIRHIHVQTHENVGRIPQFRLRFTSPGREKNEVRTINVVDFGPLFHYFGQNGNIFKKRTYWTQCKISTVVNLTFIWIKLYSEIFATVRQEEIVTYCLEITLYVGKYT